MTTSELNVFQTLSENDVPESFVDRKPLNCPVIFSDSAEQAYFELVTGEYTQSYMVDNQEIYLTECIHAIWNQLDSKEQAILDNWKPIFPGVRQ